MFFPSFLNTHSMYELSCFMTDIPGDDYIPNYLVWVSLVIDCFNK